MEWICNGHATLTGIMRHDNDMKPTEPIGRFDSQSGLWELTTTWTCGLSDGSTLVVYPGALSDGASIPAILWPFVGPRYSAATFPAAFAHDMLYAAELIDRGEADREFMRLLRLAGVSSVKAYAYYIAVRAFGWTVWRRHTRHGVAVARQYAVVVGVSPLDPIVLQQIEAAI